MSGIKISDVRISQARFDQLSRDSNDLYNLRNSLPEMQRRIREESEARVRSITNQMDSRLQAMDGRMARLSNDMRTHEKAIQKELARQRDCFQQGLDNLSSNMLLMGKIIGEQFAQLQNNMRESYRQTNERISQLHAETTKQLTMLSARVRNLEAKEKYAEQVSSQLMDYAKMQCDSIREIPMFERFAPGKLAEMELYLNSISGDMAHGAFQSALPRSREAVERLTRLRCHMEMDYAQWEQSRVAAVLAGQQLLAQLSNNREITAVDMEGHELKGVTLDTDYWATGELKALADCISKDLAELEKSDCSWDTGQIINWIEKRLPQYQDKLENICSQTRLAALLSQFRTDMGDTICNALQAQGYVLSNGASEPLFEDLDPRKALLADFESLDGVHVAFKIIPDLDNFKNTFEIHSYDADIIPESQLHARQRDINNILSTELDLDVHPLREGQKANPVVRQEFARAEKLHATAI